MTIPDQNPIAPPFDNKYEDTFVNINGFKDLSQPVHDKFCEICKIHVTHAGIISAETELILQDLVRLLNQKAYICDPTFIVSPYNGQLSFSPDISKNDTCNDTHCHMILLVWYVSNYDPI